MHPYSTSCTSSSHITGRHLGPDVQLNIEVSLCFMESAQTYGPPEWMQQIIINLALLLKDSVLASDLCEP